MWMLEIAVCDDQALELRLLGLHLERYQQLRGCERFNITWFTSSAKLLETVRDGRRYELFILDMMMPEYNGVEVGRAIRASGMDSAILYITATADFALEAISVHPEQYLLKPLDPKALYQALDDALRRRSRSVCLTIRTREGFETFPCEEIVCVEHVGRVMRVYTRTGGQRESVYLRTSFEALVESLLTRADFLQTHKSYLVNLCYVRAIQGDGFLTSVGLEVPISRRSMTAVKRRYLQYVRQG